MTTIDGSFFLGALSKVSCYLRNIAVTEQGPGRRGAPSDGPDAKPSQRHRRIDATPAPATDSREGLEASGDAGSGRRRSTSESASASGWSSWSLWARGRGMVAAAAAAAVDALSSPMPAPAPAPAPADGSSRRIPARASAESAGDAQQDGGASDGRGYRAIGARSQAREGGGGEGSERFLGTGAVAVEFSPKGCLMAIALVDGTVLLTRVERYTSGVRCVERASQPRGVSMFWPGWMEKGLGWVGRG